MSGYNSQPDLIRQLSEMQRRLAKLERVVAGVSNGHLDAQWIEVTSYQGVWEPGAVDTARYLYADGFVYLSGTARASAAADSEVFVLPEGYRPANNQQEPLIPVVSGATLRILRVEESGLVSLTGGAAENELLVFSGTMFPVRRDLDDYGKVTLPGG